MHTALFLSLVLAQAADFSGVSIKVIPVAGSVYMLEGAGGNIGVSVGEDGIVVVDDQFAPLAPKIQKALEKLSKKPITFLINTHWHHDHTGGNEVLPRGAPIVAHRNVRKRLAEDPERALGPKGWPIITFDEGLSIWANGEEIQTLHLPAGHTDGDSIIHFKKSNVVHLGDHFFVGMFPFIDLDSGGDVKGYAANVKGLLEKIPADAKIIPGHGVVCTLAELRAFSALLSEWIAIVEAGIKAGKSLDQLQKERVLAKYASYARGFLTQEMFLQILYTGLSRKKP